MEVNMKMQGISKRTLLILAVALLAGLIFSSFAAATPFGPKGFWLAEQGIVGPGGFEPGKQGRGGCGGGGGAVGLCGGGGPGSAYSMAVIIGEILGMDRAELQELHRSGQSWAEIAAAKGVSKETLAEAIVKARSDYWQQLVDEGVITAEQKNLALANIKAKIDYMLDAKMDPNAQRGRGGKMGGRGMMGGMMGGFKGPGSGANPTASY
jgi:lambda repressor-like predicted transcriptional regulator